MPLGSEIQTVLRHVGAAATVIAALAIFLGSGCSGGSSSPTSGPTAPSGTTAGVLPISSCKPPSTGGGTSLGFPRISHRLKASGDVRLTVLFVDFPDLVSDRTTASMLSLISPESESYFRAVSYGAMNLIYQPHNTWLRMSKSASAYGWNALTYDLHRAYIQEAINLAGSGVDYSKTDGIVVLSPPIASSPLTNGPALVAGAGAGVSAGGRVFANAITSGRDVLGWGPYWANHELGHNLGLQDLYANTTPGHRYVGSFSLMGLISGPAREFFAWERWTLGWVGDSQVACFGSGTHQATLVPIERAGGTKLVAVPITSTATVVAESRRVEGYDTSSVTPGILVYVVDTARPLQTGPIRVLPLNDNDERKLSAALTVGQSLSYEGVTVTFVGPDSEGDVVRVVK